MQVTLKTLQQQTFKIDIDPEETVREAGSAGRGRPRTSRGKREGSAGPERGASRRPRLSSEQEGPAVRASGESPRLTQEGVASVGFGPRALDEACGLRARAGPGMPASVECGRRPRALWQE